MNTQQKYSEQISATGPSESPFAELDTVTVLMPLPFRDGKMDKEAHSKNVHYLLGNTFLDDSRQRILGIGGTSLIHHMNPSTLFEVVELTSRLVGDDALLMAGLIPTPISEAKRFIQNCLSLKRPPDYFLLMPIPGLCNPEGIEVELTALTQNFEGMSPVRFVLYLRSSRLNDTYAKLATLFDNIVGIKVGTQTGDVEALCSTVPISKRVLWGAGDRVTEAARSGVRGHTSGLTLLCPRLCDEINNAYRGQDFETSAGLEQVVAELEEIRFSEDRFYNYSAIVAAAQLGKFQDIDLGEGGPFNAPPPPAIMERIADCVEKLQQYH